MFAYPDAARYRLGTNYQMLPTNHARCPVYAPFQRDGFMNFSSNYGADPNYVNSLLKPTAYKQSTQSATISTITEHERWVGEVCTFTTSFGQDDFAQASALWQVLGRDPGHQDRFIGNLADNLAKVEHNQLRKLAIGKHHLRES